MRSAWIIVAFVVITGTALPAAAQSRYCAPLQMELAALGQGGKSGNSARNDRALRQELVRAREQARRSGCSGGFFRKKGRSCGTITSRINRLERQLSASRPRGLALGRNFQQRERDRIRRALARHGCTPGSGSYAFGSYRTLCVRVCDGYYFPLNFTTSRQRFKGDGEKCLSQYGEGEATLFFHHSPGGDASDAVSVNGERYANQPYAFAYRSTYNPQCAAQLHRGLTQAGLRFFASLPKGEPRKVPVAVPTGAPDVPIPIARPDGAVDPETLANRAGGFVPEPVTPVAAVTTVAGVRIVGEEYLFAEANPGPPPTVPGYKTPELRDFRPALKASMLPVPN